MCCTFLDSCVLFILFFDTLLLSQPFAVIGWRRTNQISCLPSIHSENLCYANYIYIYAETKRRKNVATMKRRRPLFLWLETSFNLVTLEAVNFTLSKASFCPQSTTLLHVNPNQPRESPFSISSNFPYIAYTLFFTKVFTKDFVRYTYILYKRHNDH